MVTNLSHMAGGQTKIDPVDLRCHWVEPMQTTSRGLEPSLSWAASADVHCEVRRFHPRGARTQGPFSLLVADAQQAPSEHGPESGHTAKRPATANPGARRAACQRGTADACRRAVKTNGNADGIAAPWVRWARGMCAGVCAHCNNSRDSRGPSPPAHILPAGRG